jgi:hypothetical protein
LKGWSGTDKVISFIYNYIYSYVYFFWGRVSVGGEGTRKGGIWWMYFVPMYENRKMKPLEIVLRRRKRENDG